jgi:SGNH domain-containing protein
MLLPALLALVVACTEPHPPGPRQAADDTPRVSLATVLDAVRKAPALRVLPPDLTPALATAATDMGFDNNKCEAGPAADRIDPCVFGDRAAGTEAVLFGDSHAGMWLPALSRIAERRHWRLEFFGKPACPTPRITFWNQEEQRVFRECDRFRDFVLNRVAAERPDLVVVTNESFSRKAGRGIPVTPAAWQAGSVTTLTALHRTGAQVVVLGDTPVLDESAPECLAAHQKSVVACFTTRATATERIWNAADEAAARATGSGYVSVLPWLCSSVCTPVIGNVTVYRNRFHLTATYARMMSGILEDALLKDFPPGRRRALTGLRSMLPAPGFPPAPGSAAAVGTRSAVAVFVSGGPPRSAAAAHDRRRRGDDRDAGRGQQGEGHRPPERRTRVAVGDLVAAVGGLPGHLEPEPVGAGQDLTAEIRRAVGQPGRGLDGRLLDVRHVVRCRLPRSRPGVGEPGVGEPGAGRAGAGQVGRGRTGSRRHDCRLAGRRQPGRRGRVRTLPGGPSHVLGCLGHRVHRLNGLVGGDLLGPGGGLGRRLSRLRGALGGGVPSIGHGLLGLRGALPSGPFDPRLRIPCRVLDLRLHVRLLDECAGRVGEFGAGPRDLRLDLPLRSGVAAHPCRPSRIAALTASTSRRPLAIAASGSGGTAFLTWFLPISAAVPAAANSSTVTISAATQAGITRASAAPTVTNRAPTP